MSEQANETGCANWKPAQQALSGDLHEREKRILPLGGLAALNRLSEEEHDFGSSRAKFYFLCFADNAFAQGGQSVWLPLWGI